MTNETEVKLNKLGKPMVRDSKGHFVKGTKEGVRFGTDYPAGRPKGTKNLMTIVKNFAMAKQSTDGMTTLEYLLFEMLSSHRKIKKSLDKMDENDPRYKHQHSKFVDLGVKLAEHLVKHSGDLTSKIQAEISNSLSDEERSIMENLLRNKK